VRVKPMFLGPPLPKQYRSLLTSQDRFLTRKVSALRDATTWQGLNDFDAYCLAVMGLMETGVMTGQCPKHSARCQHLASQIRHYHTRPVATSLLKGSSLKSRRSQLKVFDFSEGLIPDLQGQSVWQFPCSKRIDWKYKNANTHKSCASSMEVLCRLKKFPSRQFRASRL
jgi:hypothetical protein